MNQKKDIIIEIHQESAYSVRIMDISADNSFFYETFCQAEDVVKEMVKEAENFYESQERRTINQCHQEKEENLNFYSNNIISFTAGRGQGKTSALRSFATNLCDFPINDRLLPKLIEKHPKSRFYVLPLIDPTMLEKRDSVLKTIFSRLFHIFQKEVEKVDCQHSTFSNQEHLSKIATMFADCFESIDTIKDQHKPNVTSYGDSLEELSRLGDSSNLKKQCYDLVSEFLSLFYPETKKNAFLVLQIDDADMNVNNAFEIMEDLRKYCMIPNVIILVATDLRQFEQIVEQHFMKEFTERIKHYGENSTGICLKLAQNYVEKLLPARHQISLPDIDRAIQNPQLQVNLRYITQEQEHLPAKSLPCYDYQMKLLSEIQQKFGIFLHKREKQLHYFLPKTMRTLSHFKVFLESVPNITVEGRTDLAPATDEMMYYFMFDDFWNAEPKLVALQLWQENLSKLMDYFLSSWASMNLSWVERNFLEKLHATPHHLKKSYIIEEISRLFHIEEHGIEKPLSQACSLADLRILLERVKDILMDKSEGTVYQFLYSIHFYLSIFCTSLLVQDLGQLTLSPTHEKGKKHGPITEEFLLPFLNGAECPWKLMSYNLPPDLWFGGFTVDMTSIATLKDFGKGANSNQSSLFANTTEADLLRTCLSEKLGGRDERPQVIFDPLNVSSLFKEKTLSLTRSDFLSEREYLNLDMIDQQSPAPTLPKSNIYIICMLTINLNWDLCYAFLQRLKEYQSEYYLNSKSILEEVFSEKNNEEASRNSPKWRNLQTHQRDFYITLSNLYADAQKLSLEPSPRSNFLVNKEQNPLSYAAKNPNVGTDSVFQDVEGTVWGGNSKVKDSNSAVELYFSGLYNVPLWDRIYLSNFDYKEVLKRVFPKEFKSFLNRYNMKQFDLGKKDLEKLYIPKSSSTVMEKTDFWKDILGSKEILIKAIGITDFFNQYTEFHKSYLLCEKCLFTIKELYKDEEYLMNMPICTVGELEQEKKIAKDTLLRTRTTCQEHLTKLKNMISDFEK